MVRVIDSRLTLLGGIALAGIVVWHARRVETPAVTLPPSDGVVEKTRREVFAFLRLPERVEPQPPTLRGIQFTAVPGPALAPKEIAAGDGRRGHRDAFFPEWYAPELASLVAGGSAAGNPRASYEKKPANAGTRGAPTKPGANVIATDDRPCQFSGTILLRDGKPAAIVKDLTSGENVLMAEGESYRGVLLVQIDFFTATFAAPTGAIYRFSTVVGGDKTFPTGDNVAARATSTESNDSPGGGVVGRERRDE